MTSNRNHICSTLLRNKESNFQLILWGKTRNVNRGKYNNPKFILIWSRNCAIEFVQQKSPTDCRLQWYHNQCYNLIRSLKNKS